MQISRTGLWSERRERGGSPSDEVGSLIDKVWYLPNLLRACMLPKANHGTWGVDGQSLEVFEAHLEDELHRLQAVLKDGIYVPEPG